MVKNKNLLLNICKNRDKQILGTGVLNTVRSLICNLIHNYQGHNYT